MSHADDSNAQGGRIWSASVLKDVLAGSGQGIAIWDRQGQLLRWNAAFESALDHLAAPLRAGADLNEVRPHLRSSLRVSERPGAAGATILFVGDDPSCRDAEIADLKLRLADAEARAALSAARVTTAFAGLNHELYRPLNMVVGFAELMAREHHGALDPRYRGYAEDILELGRWLHDLIGQILDMAKIESGKFRLTLESADIAEPIDAAIRLVKRQAEAKGVALLFSPEDDLPDIPFDHRAIKQIALSLLQNAIVATDPGGQVTVRVQREGDGVVLSVEDTGCGIHEKDLPRFGQAFTYGLASNGKSGRGLGLGLALTKSLTDLHGGALSVQSQVGVGTIVSIRLPLPARDTP